MSESTMRKSVIRALYDMHGVPVENPLRAGTPDVCYAGGWIELKWLRAWPKRPTTSVRFRHFTTQQRTWLKRHWQLGGNSFMMIQCRREWLLFEGPWAAEYVGHVALATLKKNAVWYSNRGMKDTELKNTLEHYNELSR